jgi:ferredoxin
VAGRGFTVEPRRSRQVLEVTAGQSVLQAMEEAGLYAPSDCLRGECGTCAVRIVEGEVVHRDMCLSQADRHTARLMTPCVWRSMGERLVLDL